jgi:membrane-associated protease RseP (regulator of RpoE activity)
VTQIKSLLPDRTHLFDVAAAGPLAGGAAAAALFVFGLAASASSGGALPAGEGAEAARAAALAAGLVPVPQALFQGSLLLGGVARTVLASGATAGARELFVHPAFVAGWCGLTATALNCLPLGCTDGGRMAIAAWGRPRLTGLSAASYIGLALGLLAGPLSLSWGLYVLLVQRTPERAPLDGLTPTDEQRSNVALALMLAAAAILLPLELPPLQ